MIRVACIGGAHLDRILRAEGDVRPGTSNPARETRSLGGVAANVARIVARLGGEPLLISTMGMDADGRWVTDALTREGLSYRSVAAGGHTTPQYTAFLDARGELASAMAAMGGYDAMTPEAFLDARVLGDMKTCDIWFADANLQRETLMWLSGQAQERIFAVNAVSVAKAERLRGVPYDLGFFNAAEARIVLGNGPLSAWSGRYDGTDHTDVITFGRHGVVALEEGLEVILKAAPATVRDVTGAGDALIGATLMAWANASGRKDGARVWPGVRDCLTAGICAAALVVEGEGSLPPGLTADALAARVAAVGDDLDIEWLDEEPFDPRDNPLLSYDVLYENVGRELAAPRIGNVSNRPDPPVVVSEWVREALRGGRPVVALESTIIAHGLPRPRNLDVGRALEAAIQDAGAVPATIAVLDGYIHVGLSERQMVRVAGEDMPKLSRRDLGLALARGGSGATTVAATMIGARLAGIRVFATGGIGGVHRGAETSFDVSADLEELARTPVAVVCAGAKSILDLPKTLEVLETRGVPVIGYGTDTLPAFYTRSSGHALTQRVDTPEEAAAMIAMQARLGFPGGAVIAVPIPEGDALDASQVEAWIAEALAEADARGVQGKEVTPFLLQHLAKATGGAALEANVALARNNAGVAARIASALLRHV